jgi:hypothetical protein
MLLYEKYFRTVLLIRSRNFVCGSDPDMYIFMKYKKILMFSFLKFDGLFKITKSTYFLTIPFGYYQSLKEA